MNLASLLVATVVLFSSKASGGEDLDHDEHHDDAFESILTILGLNGSLHANGVTEILNRLGLRECSEHKCVDVETLLHPVNVSTNSSLSEDIFQKIAPKIVYSLIAEEEEHADENTTHHDDDHEEATYGQFLTLYKTNEVCEQILDQIMKDLNESIGTQLTGNKCFSSHDILHELNISSSEKISEENFEEISTFIVAELLRNSCIEVENNESLPCPSFFAEDLFTRYAENGVIHDEDLERLMSNLNIGKEEKHDQEDHGGEDDHDGHDHRRRRDIQALLVQQAHEGELTSGGLIQHGRRKRSADDDHEDEHDHHEVDYQKCYSTRDLMAIFGANSAHGIDVETFRRLSTGLLHQVATNACKVEAHSNNDNKHEDEDVEDSKVWGYGVVAVLVISVCSLMGVLVIPFFETTLYKKMIIFLISLAVGTLVGDALLHLMPHAIGLHSDHDHDHEEEDKTFLWRFLAATGGIYIFYVFESLTHLFFKTPMGHLHDVEHRRSHNQFESSRHAHGNPETDLRQKNGDDSFVMANKAAMASAMEEGNQGNGEKSAKVKKKISSVAWMIIIGDTIHNIADGIAIGVAFTDSISGGISTSIAVFCHELPHELGDFAVLLSAGMSVKAALFANFVSSLSCFIGLVFGILIGEIQDVNMWIFAVTAGFFLYIALTDMLPEVMHGPGFADIHELTIFLLQNLGMLMGFGIMILLAYYEERIRI